MDNRSILPKLIAVVGPTASGKSSLGEALSLALGGEIISADSRQVYQGLDIGSGKEVLKVPQHCLDVAVPGTRYTVTDWKSQAEVAIASLYREDKVPVVVGGTGLYVTALIKNFQFAPESLVDRADMAERSTADLVEELEATNPSALAGLDPRNRRFLERAVEKTRAGWQQPKPGDPLYDVLLVGREWPRPELYKRIDRRVDERLKEGMIGEVEGLLKDGVPADWLRSLGLEYRFLTDYLEGRYKSQDEMVEKLKFAIHHFARRQLIWWRRYDVNWVDSVEQAIKVARDFLRS